MSASTLVISTASARHTSCCHRYPVILFAVFLSSAYVVTLRDYPPDDPDRPSPPVPVPLLPSLVDFRFLRVSLAIC